LILFYLFLIDGSDLILCRDNFIFRFAQGFFVSLCLISFLIFCIQHRFLHVLDVDGPALLGLKFFAFFKALNYEAKSRELAGAIAYYLGARYAKSCFKVD
jgi:predicted neutral ceramidase superfamily lipid hydrolase